jgi:hypothetical protein
MAVAFLWRNSFYAPDLVSTLQLRLDSSAHETKPSVVLHKMALRIVVVHVAARSSECYSNSLAGLVGRSILRNLLGHEPSIIGILQQ